MQSPFAAKEILAGDTPLFFFDVALPNGTALHWCTRNISWNGTNYDARVLKNSLFESQLATDTGIGGVPKLTFELANADSGMSQIEWQTGFKGSSLTVTLAFLNLATGAATSDSSVVFRGVMNPPDSVTESTLRLSALNRMTMQRAVLPEVRVQRMCPWRFPSTAAQRSEAVDGAIRGKFSPLYRCGYSPDQSNGVGNLNGSVPFTSCANTRVDCEVRGMFTKDLSNRTTGSFGGFEFVPASTLVRGNGQSSAQVSAVLDNQARYNDFVPLLYGTQWHSPDIVFTRNDGNLTRMEVLLGMGALQGVLQVLVNDVEIPRGQAGVNMTSTGWYNVVSWGSRNGVQNGDFTDSTGAPLGDPYGSMAYLSVVVPNRVSNGNSLPKVQVMVQGLKLYMFDSSGSYVNELFSDNPAWVLLDVLMRSGWTLEELDKGSFARAAAYAGEMISEVDPAGGSVQLPRFQCNFAMKDRRSAGEVIRSIRSSSRIYLVQNSAGLLEARIENTFALQQANKPVGSNSVSTFNGGWPAYEFDLSSIARKSDGSSSVTLSSKGTQDTPNRMTIEFQDSLNLFQQDSLSLSDGDDADLCGAEIAINLDAVGISTFNQAARMLLLALNRSVDGNRHITFDTSVKGLGLAPGDLITIRYPKEGLSRTPFRIARVAPGAGYRTATISAQIHDDSWYSDSTDVLAGAIGKQPGQSTGLPQPVAGIVLDANGNLQLGIAESAATGTDGAPKVDLGISFAASGSAVGNLPAPLVGLVPTIEAYGGTISGPAIFYYSVAAVDAQGNEGGRSFVAQAAIGMGSTNAVTLTGIQLPRGGVSYHVYRGIDPRLGFRVASNVTPNASGTSSFADSGSTTLSILPPDPLADHYNVYWRWELLPESNATGSTLSTIAHSDFQIPVNALAGMRAWISRGPGAGQERTIVSNTADTLTVSPLWAVQPAAQSFFCVAENAWRFGCTGAASPITFDVPERIGAGVHVLVRTATADNTESPQDISPVTRWILGQSGGLSADNGTPPEPLFGVTVAARRPGALEISSIAFATLTNTRGITAGTFKLQYFDELGGVVLELRVALGLADVAVSLTGEIMVGNSVQIEQEICVVTGANPDGTYQVSRGALGTMAAAHATPASCFVLSKKDIVIPFVKGFFGSSAAGTWSYLVDLPNVRLASVEGFATNAFGDGTGALNAYTSLRDGGLRTLLGGQLSFQISGYLAVQTGAAPDIFVQTDRSVGNVYASLRTAPSASGIDLQINVNGQSYGTLHFNSGQITSSVIDGVTLPVLREGDRMSLDVTSVGTSVPGSDLTVVIGL